MLSSGSCSGEIGAHHALGSARRIPPLCFRGFSGAPVFPEFFEISYLLLRIPAPSLPFIVISLFPFTFPKGLLNEGGGKVLTQDRQILS